MGTPISVAEHVLASVLNEGGTAEERIELLRRRLEMLRQAIGEITRRLEDDEFMATQPSSVVAEHRRQRGEMKTEYEAIDRVLRKLG